MTDYSVYKPYANDYEKQLIQLLKTSTREQVASQFQICVRTLERHLKKLREKATSQGFDIKTGMDFQCPEGFEVSSIRVDTKGTFIPSFKPTKANEFQDIIEAFSKPLKPVNKIPAPKKTAKELLNLYTISDYHLGMLSWAKETGEDWDLDIASNLLLNAFALCIERSPDAETCFINILGDFFHIDSILPVTPAHKHVLDSDTRYFKLVDTGVQILRQMIDMSLVKHKHVKILVAEGNHDESTAPVIQILLAALYDKNPRLEVVKSPKNYYSYVFGNTFLCFHHGHKRHKPSDLTKLFSSDPFFRKDWGRCRYAYGHSGHLHHERAEDGGCLWTQHPTLAARDAHSARLAYVAMRGCISFTYHIDYGEYSSFYVKPEMLGDL